MNGNLEKKALYEIIADKLEEMILNDLTEFKKKLPSEQRLAETFSVSRPVIREALKLLKERGLIESHQGASSVIIEYSPQSLLKSFSRFSQTKKISPVQIHQVRTALELLSARMAAKNASLEDIEQLKEINERLKTSKEKKEISQLDTDFHKRIATASQNPLLEGMYEVLSGLIEQFIEKSTSDQARLDGIAWHEKIITAIENGNAEEAATLVQQHLLLSIRNFEHLNDE